MQEKPKRKHKSNTNKTKTNAKTRSRGMKSGGLRILGKKGWREYFAFLFPSRGLYSASQPINQNSPNHIQADREWRGFKLVKTQAGVIIIDFIPVFDTILFWRLFWFLTLGFHPVSDCCRENGVTGRKHRNPENIGVFEVFS